MTKIQILLEAKTLILLVPKMIFIGGSGIILFRKDPRAYKPRNCVKTTLANIICARSQIFNNDTYSYCGLYIL